MDKSFDQKLQKFSAIVKTAESKSITYGGTKGNFVSAKVMRSLNEASQELMDYIPKMGDKQEAFLKDLDKIQKFESDAIRFKSSIEAHRATIEKQAESIKQVEYRSEQAEAAFKAANVEHQARQAALRKELEAERTKATELKKALAFPSNRHDLEVLQSKTQQLEDATKEVTRLQQALAATNAANKSQDEEVKSLRAMALSLKASNDAYQAEINAAFTARRALDEELFSTKPVVIGRPEIKNEAVRKLLGDKGIKWLHEAETLTLNDTKERAYKLMLSVNGSAKERVKSLHQLLEIVWRWLKGKAYRARKSIESWITKVENDLRSGQIKSITYYRDELVKLRADILQVAPKKVVKTPDGDAVVVHKKLTLFEEVYYTGKVLWRRTKVQISKAKNSTNSWFGSHIVDPISKFWRQIWRPSTTYKPVSVEEVFEVENL